MNEVVGHSAYVCVNVYTCDPFTRDGAERNFLLWYGPCGPLLNIL